MTMTTHEYKVENGVGTHLNGQQQNGTSEKKPIPTKDEPDTAQQVSWVRRYAFLLAMLLNHMFDGLGSSVNSQFRYRYFHARHQDQLDQYNITKGSECGDADLQPEVQDIENAISKETAQWGLYGDYIHMLPLLLASLFLGMKSDQIGRRFLFLFPIIISIISYGIKAVVIGLDLNYGWILIALFITACSGGSISMKFAGYAFLSDSHGKKNASPAEDNNVTPSNPAVQSQDNEKKTAELDDTDLDMSRERSRTFKIVGLDVAVNLTSSLMAFGTGYIIEYLGFFYSTIIIISGKVLLFFFAYCFVSESQEQKRSAGLMVPLRIIRKALKDPRKRRTLILCNLGIFITVYALHDEAEILHTYEMSPPFCLDAIQLGWLSSESRLRGLFTMPLLWVWKRVGMNEPTIAAVGILSYMASALVLATIRHIWVFFTTPVIGIPGTLITAMTKAISSRLIGRSALASTFALMLAGEQIFMFAGSVSSSYMYQRFLPTLPTAPFYLASAFFGVAFILFLIETLCQRRSSQAHTTDAEINIQK